MIGKRLTTEEFIKRATSIHDGKYNYSKSEYYNYNTKIEIICKKHGSFWQNAGNHLFKNGCPKCAENVKLTSKEIIKKFKKIHGNKYNYSEVDYVGRQVKVKIFCKKHNKYFFQYKWLYNRRKNECSNDNSYWNRV